MTVIEAINNTAKSLQNLAKVLTAVAEQTKGIGGGQMIGIIKELNVIKPDIPNQTYKTIMGQIRAGDCGGATVGINRLKRRMEREEDGRKIAGN